MSLIVTGLRNGKSLEISAVFLCPRDEVLEAMRLQSAAAGKMGGISSGLGLWGSPGWVVGGMLAVGALEALASKSAYKEGVEIAQQAAHRMRTARENGKFIPVANISGLESPQPTDWVGRPEGRVVVRVNGVPLAQVDALCAANGIDPATVYVHRGLIGTKFLMDEIRVADTRNFIHTGTEFLTVLSDGEVIQVRWTDVTTYTCHP
ncbi:hypothetical protein KL86APRO_12041 [uncultured Alphaproteobacteria bacterium]|uniref:Uncharacterized protein n=1 Tax=uncultured Alphaproteobacteria bacterium TaxID=91750 RepID=A0A212K2S2_9PROT|nr:hypothetical protein KL86APRO_12041 [uncultured Alphaproteobacteria bacterium]